MSQQHLCCDNLGSLDHGQARTIIDQSIADALTDLDNRGDDGRPRRVVIVLELERNDNGTISGHVECHVKAPVRKTCATIGVVKQSKGGGAQLLFSEHAPDNPAQTTMDRLHETE